MNVLITGANGFVGKNLVVSLQNIMSGKDQSHPEICIDNLYCYDKNSDLCLLDEYCKNADFVYHLAGVNRSADQSEFKEGNVDFTLSVLNKLKKYNNKCPILLASSIQASLVGRYKNSVYGMSKKNGEELLFQYSKENDAKVCVYRFPNLFGKWCKPNYNSVIATFCYNIANGIDIQIDDPNVELELLYIDDLIEELLNVLENKEHRCEYVETSCVENSEGKYCFVPGTYHKKLGDIADFLKSYADNPFTLTMPVNENKSFEKRLISTYLSYLPSSKMIVPFNSHMDERGSFTELVKMDGFGQISINVSKPGQQKGNHWHKSKWEIFVVVSGHGLIQERKIGVDENGDEFPIEKFEVSGEKLEAVYMLPGYVHSITNLSKTENLVIVIWTNEIFDPNHPDTYRELVIQKE